MLDTKPIIQSKVLSVIPTLSPSYSVKFEVKITRFRREFNNIMQLLGGNRNVARVDLGYSLGLQRNMVSICGAYKCPLSALGVYVPLHQWTTIEMTQRKQASSGDYLFIAKIGNVVLGPVMNKSPRTYRNVKVYASNPWHPPPQGFIRNMVINPEA